MHPEMRLLAALLLLLAAAAASGRPWVDHTGGGCARGGSCASLAARTYTGWQRGLTQAAACPEQWIAQSDMARAGSAGTQRARAGWLPRHRTRTHPPSPLCSSPPPRPNHCLVLLLQAPSQ